MRQVRANKGLPINRHWGNLLSQGWSTADIIAWAARQKLVA